MPESDNGVQAFGWFSPAKKAFIIRKIVGRNEAGRAELEKLGMIFFVQDYDNLKAGTHRGKSILIRKERPYTS